MKQIFQNSVVFPVIYQVTSTAEMPQKTILKANTKQNSLAEQIRIVLIEINENLKIFKQTRKQVKKQYPLLFVTSNG